jgi:hypothetical protein
MEGSCEYTEQAVVDGRNGVGLQLGAWEGLATTRDKKNPHVTKYYTRNEKLISGNPCYQTVQNIAVASANQERKDQNLQNFNCTC